MLEKQSSFISVFPSTESEPRFSVYFIRMIKFEPSMQNSTVEISVFSNIRLRAVTAVTKSFFYENRIFRFQKKYLRESENVSFLLKDVCVFFYKLNYYDKLVLKLTSFE